MKLIHKQYVSIPVVIGNRTIHNKSTVAKTRRQRVLIRINRHLPDRPRVSSGVTTPADNQSRPSAKQIADAAMTPSVYVLNAAALSKPGSVQHLAADIQSYGVSVAIITETHYKVKHTDSMVNIDGFTVHRRDRLGRRGGGVAVYVASSLRSSRWKPSVDSNSELEIEWVHVGARTFIAALYHPPKPTYQPEVLLDYIEDCVAEISHDFPLADIVLAGDVNQLSEQDIIERTGLTQIVHQPTRGGNILDRVFVSDPNIFNVVRVVASVVKSDHKAVVCLPDRQSSTAPKTRERCSFRRHTPSQHAKFLEIAASIDFTNPLPTASSDPAINTQAEFDNFYRVALSLLDEIFPIQTVTVTSRDRVSTTSEIKAMLRRKNRLMRDGRVEKAGAIAARIGKKITAQSRLQLRGINARTDTKVLWAAVRKLTNAGKSEIVVDGITAQSLNDYYAATSTDRIMSSRNAGDRRDVMMEALSKPPSMSANGRYFSCSTSSDQQPPAPTASQHGT